MKKIILSFVIWVFVFNSFAFAEVDNFFSVYTDISHCKLIEEDKNPEGLGYVKYRCPEQEGYKVTYEGADSRGWLIFEKGTQKIDTRQMWKKEPLFFLDVVLNKIEWRYQTIQGKKQLYAVIYRSFGQDPDTGKDNLQRLHVLRVEPGKWCSLAWVNSNEEARKVADSNQKCP